MREVRIPSEEFDANVFKCMRLAQDTAVVIAENGEGRFVLLNYKDYVHLERETHPLFRELAEEGARD